MEEKRYANCFYYFGNNASPCLTCDRYSKWRPVQTFDTDMIEGYRAFYKTMLNAVYGTHEKYEALKAKTTFFMPKIKKVIFNDPATIVFWSDDSKTVVKCQEGDTFDPEKGLAMAIAKKALGNKGNYCNELKKWLPKEEEAKKIELSYDGPSLAQMLKEAIGQSKLLECGPDTSLS